MRVPRRKLAQVIAEQIRQGGFGKKQAVAVASYLLAGGRTAELSSLLRDVQQLWAEHGEVEVVASSAYDLSPEVQHDIQTEVRRVYPKARHVGITCTIDSTVVGGVQLQFVDRRLDLSIAGKLRQFKTLAIHGKD